MSGTLTCASANNCATLIKGQAKWHKITTVHFTLLFRSLYKRMITATDDRAKAILQWLTNDLNLDISQFETASSDASFRRYFRVQHQQQHYIVMDAPPDKEDTAPFIKVAFAVVLS
jgi:hypothetical protein